MIELSRAHPVRYFFFFKSPLGLYLSDCTNMMIMSHYGISVVINVRLYDSQDELKMGARKKTCPDTSSDCKRLGYVCNPRSLMEGTETLCRDDITWKPQSSL